MVSDASLSYRNSFFVYASSERSFMLRFLSAIRIDVPFLQLYCMSERLHVGCCRVPQWVRKLLLTSVERRIRHVYRRSGVVRKLLRVWRVVPDAAVSLFRIIVEHRVCGRLSTARVFVSFV